MLNTEIPCLSQSDIESGFRQFMTDCGVTPPPDFEYDGRTHPVPLEGKPANNKTGRYAIRTNPHSYVLLVWDWSDGRDQKSPRKKLFSKDGTTLTFAQRREDRAFEKELQREEKAKTAKKNKITAQKTNWMIENKVASANPNHAYLKRKGVAPIGIYQLVEPVEPTEPGKPTFLHKKLAVGDLIIPLRDFTGKIWSFQFIKPDGTKLFPAGGRKKGLFFCILGDGKNLMPHFCEGYTTGADICRATGANVYVCLDAGNLPVVGEEYLKAKPPRPGEPLTMVICGDNDKWHYQWETENGGKKQGKTPPEGAQTIIIERTDNPGRKSAMRAATIAGKVPGVNPVVAIPELKAIDPGKSDFNDLRHEGGIDEVRRQIDMAVKEGDRHHPAETKDDNSPDPEPLIKTPLQEPYPTGSLPVIMKESIEEAHEDNGAAIPLISAIHHSYLSYATQPLAMVRRDDRRVGPIGTSFFTLGGVNSGKTTNDDLLSSTIESHVVSETEKMEEAVNNRKAMISSIESKIAGVKDRIRQLSKEGKNTNDKEEELKKLISEQSKIPVVYIPSLPLVDSSRQYIIKHLIQVHPSAAVITGEGGILLNSYAFSKEQITGTVHAWCDLWSGKALDLNSVSRGRMIARGGRLTVGVALQQEQFERFLSKNENLYTLKDSGFFARTFMADAGPRNVKEYSPVKKLKKVMAYKENLLKLLGTPLKIVDGVLMPDEMELSEGARKLWIEYYEETMTLPLDSNQYFHRFSGKGPENAARLACQYQLLENAFSSSGLISEVSEEYMRNAIILVKWYANEQARYFGEVDMPQELKDAERLDHWIGKRVREKNWENSITRREILQCGPPGLRKTDARDKAIAELVASNRVIITKEGRKELLHLHEKLLHLLQSEK